MGHPVNAYRYEAALPSALLAFTLLDAIVTEWQLCVRLGGKHLQAIRLQREYLMKLVEWLQSRPARHTAKLREESWSSTYRMLWAITMMDISDNYIDQAVDRLHTLEEKLRGDVYFEHDMILLKEVKSNKSVSILPCSNNAKAANSSFSYASSY